MGPPNSSGIYHFDAFRLDPASGAVLGADGAELRLRPKAYAMLRHLLDNPGRLLGRDELLDTLWPGVVVTDDSLTQCVGDLRHALGTRAAHVLKTVPKRGYALVAEVRRDEASPPETRPDAQPAPSPAPLPQRDLASLREDPVAVHPFEAPDEERACILLAASLSADLVAVATRIEGMRVRPATDAAPREGYRVTGQVRAVGADIRVTLRLEDAMTGAAIWAERLDHPRDGFPGLSEARLLALAAQLNRQVGQHSLAAARGKPLDALSARELTLIGREHHGRVTEEDTAKAQAMFERAIAVDPDYAQAYAWQAYTVQRSITHGWGEPGGQAARDEVLRLARRAVQLQPESTLCLSRFAFALVLNQRWEEAVDAARAAMASNRPAFGFTRITCCEVLTAAGHPEEAAELAQETIALEPLAPPSARGILGRALLLAGRVEEALAPLRWCASHLPDYAATFDTLVVAAVEGGRLPEAVAARRELLRIRPDWRPQNHTGFWYFRHPEDVARFQAAHRRLAELDGAAGAALTAEAVPSQASPLPRSRPAVLSAPPPAQKVEMFRQDRLVFHPLHAASDDAAAARAATVLTSDLMAELVQHEDLRVIAGPDAGPKQGFQVKGEVHEAGGRLHAVIRLEDLVTGTVFWAQRVDWSSGDAPSLPGERIAALAAAMELQIGRKSLRRARQKSAEALTARELTLLGKEHYHRGLETETAEARRLFVQATAIDPGYAVAHAWHALAMARIAVQGWSAPDDGAVVAQAVQLARRAVELQPELPLPLAALALSLALQERWGEAVASAKLALQTSWVVGDVARIMIGDVLTAAGHPAEAEEVLRHTVARDPHCSPLVHGVLGRALLLAGRPEEALAELRLCVARLPDYALGFRIMVVAAVEAGLVEDAQEALREVERLRPAWVGGEQPIPWFLQREEDAKRWDRAFRMATRLDATAKQGGLIRTPVSRT